MTYEALRDFADTWGLLFLIALILMILVFIFRRGTNSEYRRAARIATDAPEVLSPTKANESADDTANDSEKRGG